MTYQTTTRRILPRVPNWRPVIIAAASAAFGAAAAVAVMAGWSAFGPVHAARASGQAAITMPAGAPVERHYPASREGLRGQVFSDDPIAAAAAISAPVQPHYPGSREGVRGQVFSDEPIGATAASGAGVQGRYPASREGVRGPVAE